MENYIPNDNYSLLYIRIAFVRLTYQLCVTGNRKYNQPKPRMIPFNRELEVSRMKNEVEKYCEEKQAS